MTETTIDQFEEEVLEEIEEDFDPEPDDSNVEESERFVNIGISRTNTFLAALVILQLFLAAFMLWPRGGRVASGEPLLAGFPASAAEGEIEAAPAVDGLSNLVLTDDTGAFVTLERNGDEWVLGGTDGFPVNVENVSEVAEKLADINGDRLVTRTSSSHERLQVSPDDFVRKIDITTDEGVQTLYVGSSPASNATHVRLDGQDETYLAGDINSWELAATASNWIDTNYYQATANDVTEITLENENGTFTFTRPAPAAEGSEDAPEREWSLFGLGLTEELNQSAITTLVSQSANLRMTTPLGKSAQPEYGIDSPQATVTLTFEPADGEKSTSTLTVGAQNDDLTDYVIKSSASDYYVQLSSVNAEQFINKSRTDFVTEIEPEVTGEAGSEENSEE